MTLQERYERLCSTSSSINEHLPTLRRYAERCESVAEFGVDVGQSTTAFLMAQPKMLLSWDIVQNPALEELFSLGSGCRRLQDGVMIMIRDTFWNFTLQDSRIGSLPEVDLLFIDSAHCYEQMKAELERHHTQVRRWIICHDCVTFGRWGEAGEPQVGIMSAIDEFFAKHPEWCERERLLNDNGLIVLERVNAN